MMIRCEMRRSILVHALRLSRLSPPPLMFLRFSPPRRRSAFIFNDEPFLIASEARSSRFYPRDLSSPPIHTHNETEGSSRFYPCALFVPEAEPKENSPFYPCVIIRFPRFYPHVASNLITHGERPHAAVAPRVKIFLIALREVK